MVSGSSLYTRYRKDVRKFGGSGKQLWLKTQAGLNTIVMQDMTGDGSGNVYLSGKLRRGWRQLQRHGAQARLERQRVVDENLRHAQVR